MNDAPPPGPKRSIRRNLMTGAAVGILAIGFWLGTLFNGFGLGNGEQGSTEPETDSPGGTPVTVAPDDVSVDLGNPSLVRPTPDGTAEPDEPLVMIAVLVKGDGFAVLRNPPPNVSMLGVPLSQHFQNEPLDDIVQLALDSPGNASGVKVQIVKHKSSTVGGDSSLRTALKNAGIPDGAIHVYTGFHD